MDSIIKDVKYQTEYKTKRECLKQIFISLACCIVAFAVPQVCDFQFEWIYEVAIIIISIGIIYILLKKRCYLYVYTIFSDDVISVTLSLSSKSKQTMLCGFNRSDIVNVIDLSEKDIKLIKKEYDIKFEYNCPKMQKDDRGTGIVFKDATNGKTSLLVFRPDNKFLQILSENSIDKHGDV